MEQICIEILFVLVMGPTQAVIPLKIVLIDVRLCLSGRTIRGCQGKRIRFRTVFHSIAWCLIASFNQAGLLKNQNGQHYEYEILVGIVWDVCPNNLFYSLQANYKKPILTS